MERTVMNKDSAIFYYRNKCGIKKMKKALEQNVDFHEEVKFNREWLLQNNEYLVTLSSKYIKVILFKEDYAIHKYIEHVIDWANGRKKCLIRR